MLNTLQDSVMKSLYLNEIEKKTLYGEFKMSTAINKKLITDVGKNLLSRLNVKKDDDDQR